MKPLELLHLVIRPTLEWLGSRYLGWRAEVLLLAIAIQESDLRFRAQHPGGPARSWWQIEPQTALAVLRKWEPARRHLEALLGDAGAGVGASREDVQRFLQLSEVGACACARGLLWLDPHPLPLADSAGEAAAWATYLRVWRPGQPRPESWPRAHGLAVEAVWSRS